MPCYPALALLLGSAMAADGVWVRRGTRVLAAITGLRGRGRRADPVWPCATFPPRAISRRRSRSIPALIRSRSATWKT